MRKRAVQWMRVLWRRLVPERARRRIYQWRRRAAIGLAPDLVGPGSVAATPGDLSVLFRGPPLGTLLLHHRAEGSVLDRPESATLVPYRVAGRERLATCSGVSWFRGPHLAVVNLYGGHLRIYRFEPERPERGGPAQLRLLHERSEGLSCPEDVAVSPDGRLLAITHSLSKRNRVSLHRIDPESLEPGPAFETMGSGHTCHGACFSPDSRHLAFTEVGGAGAVEVVDVTSSPARRTCRLENRLPATRPKSVCFTRDGRYVAVAHSSLARPDPGSTTYSGRLAIHRFDAGTGVIEEGCETFVSSAAIGALEIVSFLAGGAGAAYRLVATDQATDRVSEFIFDPQSRSLRASGRQVPDLCFPHGVDVSADGDLLAVTNYGDDSLRVLRLTPPDAGPARDRRKHVLLCAHRASPPLMGAERSLLELAAALSRLGYRVSCLLPEKDHAYAMALSEHVEQVVHLPFPWWSRDRPFEEETVARIEEFLRREEVDLVHVNTCVILDPLVAARRAGVPSVLHVRELLADDPSLAEHLGCDGAAAVRRLQREADFLITNSHATHRMFRVKGRSFCLRNAVDAERFDLPEIRDRGPLRVGTVSSNVPKKGIGDLVELAMRARSDPALEFLAIGPRGEATRSLEEAVERASPRPRLRFVEFVPDPGQALAMLDVVLSLTRVGESFGRSIAEAMASRRPVIAYARGAMPELVVHDRTGFLVPAGDLQAILLCLRALEEDRLRAREMGRAGRRRMQEAFSVAAFERSLDAIYRRILPTSSASGARPARDHGTPGSRRGLSA